MIRNPLLMLTGLGDLLNSIRLARTVRAVDAWMQLDGPTLERFQQERLRKIVAYAYENVELYNRKWRRAGVRPDDVHTTADLKRLPITTKDDLRLSPPGDILSREFRSADCYEITTSGSTGSPIRLRLDEDKALIDIALSVPKYLAGMPPVTALAAIRDFVLRRDISFMAIVVKKEYLYHRIFWTMKHSVVDALDTPDAHIQQINRKRPRCLYAYPSVIRNICVRAREKGIAMHPPHLIVVAGEVVDGHLRNLVGRTFGVDVLDAYGSTETGHIAAECTKHEGMHILDVKVLVELLDNEGRDVPAGVAGRVVVTDLFSKATPIIRYDGLGDYAVRKEEPCSCGRPQPLLARVEGRTVDTITLPDGDVVHPYHLTLALEDVPHLSKFQIRQERPDYLRVLLVKDKLPEAQTLSFAEDGAVGRQILDRFNKILRTRMRIDLVTVEDIPRPPGSRKYATVVSTIQRD